MTFLILCKKKLLKVEKKKSLCLVNGGKIVIMYYNTLPHSVVQKIIIRRVSTFVYAWITTLYHTRI